MKNQKEVLVPAGRWKLSGFKYGRSNCMCCGRPICRCFIMKNLDHEAKVARDPNYTFPETIVIGCVCGPDLLAKSSAGFYDDPELEWARQYAVFKDYIKYVLLCEKNHDIWQSVPHWIRVPVDEFLDGKWRDKHDGKHTGPWWKVRDAKRSVLTTSRDSKGLPNIRVLKYRVDVLVTAARNVGIIINGEENKAGGAACDVETVERAGQEGAQAG